MSKETLPRVVTVFQYFNPKAPRAPREEFEQLIKIFTEANLNNLASFVKVVQFFEAEHKVSVSYNLSLMPRIDTDKEPSVDEFVQMMCQKDLLIGTRRGVEGAFVWLNNLAGFLPTLPADSVEFLDTILGEALECFTNIPKSMTLDDLIEIASGNKEVGSTPGGQKH